MKMDDKPNPSLPMYRETLGAAPEMGEPRRFFAYLYGMTVVPCTALELARHPGDPTTENVLRKTTLGTLVVKTRFSSVRLDRMRRLVPDANGEPYWFETTSHRVGGEDITHNHGYYKTYEEALNGHGQAVHALMRQSEPETITDR